MLIEMKVKLKSLETLTLALVMKESSLFFTIDSQVILLIHA